jgi:glycosyltransferase involved in cell wall biosynthesis
MALSILFVGCAYSDIQKNRFRSASRRGYQFAAQNLQEALIEGFLSNGVGVNVISIPSLSTFPLGSSIVEVEDCDYVYKGHVLGHCFGYHNIPFFKSFKHEEIDEWVDNWYASAQGIRCIFVYALIGTHMSIALRAKQRYPDVLISIIVPDLPMFMGCNIVYKALGLQKKAIEWINENVRCFDRYVVLTEPMVNRLGVADKPYTVLEGVYSGRNEQITISKNEDIIILYAGGLVLRYGIKDLIDAFMKIDGDRFRLWLCGAGDAIGYIKECMRKDNRIVYYGTVPESEIGVLQKKATVLVNPRHSNEEFTKYSFPSKTIEYMASGTPTLMCHLPSIPPEYDDYLYYFADESVEGMAKMMIHICEKPAEELANKGQRAREFIVTNKNAKKQTSKILVLLQS